MQETIRNYTRQSDVTVDDAVVEEKRKDKIALGREHHRREGEKGDPRRIFNACGGGTGSGLGCLLLERLSVDYGKKSKISFTVWSCPQISSACVEPYNTVLCVHSLLEHTDVTNQVTNAWSNTVTVSMNLTKA